MELEPCDGKAPLSERSGQRQEASDQDDGVFQAVRPDGRRCYKLVRSEEGGSRASPHLGQTQAALPSRLILQGFLISQMSIMVCRRALKFEYRLDG